MAKSSAVKGEDCSNFSNVSELCLPILDQKGVGFDHEEKCELYKSQSFLPQERRIDLQDFGMCRTVTLSFCTNQAVQGVFTAPRSVKFLLPQGGRPMAAPWEGSCV